MTVERPFYRKVWDFLGSRDLSVFIFVMGMTYFLILSAFGAIVSLPRVEGISKLLPYKVLYILFFVNLTICEIKWMPIIIKRCKKPKPPKTAEEMERFGHKIAVSGQQSAVSGLERYLSRRGYGVEGPGARGRGSASLIPHPSSLILYAHKGRFSPAGNLLFHLGFFFLLIGFGLSLFFRFEGEVSLVEGQGVTGESSEFTYYQASSHVMPPKVAFEVEKIIPSFWKDILLFKELKAYVTYNGGKGVVLLSKPLVMDGAKVTITGMGVAPAYSLKDGQGRELDSGYVNLNIFVPNTEDVFNIPNTPYMVQVRFYPDFEMRDGRPFSRSMNSVNPVFRVKVSRKGNVVYRGYLKPRDEAAFDGLTLSFPEVKYTGIFRVVYDRGFGFIWAGFTVMISGLLWRLLLYRKEVILYRNERGERFLAGRADFHHNLFASELRRFQI